MSRIGKGKDDSQVIHRRHSVNPQQQKIYLNELHQKEMPHESPSKQRRHSLPNTKDLGNQKYDFQRKPVDPQDDDHQIQANIISSTDKVKPLTSSIDDKANLLKNTHKILSINDKTNESLKKSALNKYNTNTTLLTHPENVGFKKINDRIVKVNEIIGLPMNRSEKSSQEFNLTNELMESLDLSDSNNSTSTEDGPVSQSHRPLPHFPSRHTDHKDESLDLSDDDYASDAPSEIDSVSRFSEERPSSTPTSSSSSSGSESEPESLRESNHFEKTDNQHVQNESKWTRESRPPCASERRT